MTMKNLQYIKQEAKANLWMSDIIKLEKETKTIEKAIRFFVSFANEVDGGVCKTWEQRNKKRLDTITENYKILLGIVGKDTIEKILATNILKFVVPPKAKDLKLIKSDLLQKLDITDYNDLDLRYSVSEEFFIFWDSIMYIVNTMDVA